MVGETLSEKKKKGPVRWSSCSHGMGEGGCATRRQGNSLYIQYSKTGLRAKGGADMFFLLLLLFIVIRGRACVV